MAEANRKIVVPKGKNSTWEMERLHRKGWRVVSGSSFVNPDGSVVVWMHPPATSNEGDSEK